MDDVAGGIYLMSLGRGVGTEGAARRISRHGGADHVSDVGE